MAGPSQLVKGIDDGIGVRGSQVDVDCGAVDGAVTKPGFKGQEVKAVLVAVGSVGMAERMSAEAGIHAKCFPVLKDDSLEPLLIHGLWALVCWVKSHVLGFKWSGQEYQ